MTTRSTTGIGKLAAILDEQIAAGPGVAGAGVAGTGPGGTGPGGMTGLAAEDACAAVMRALVGNAPAPDDIAVLVLSRHPALPVPSRD